MVDAVDAADAVGLEALLDAVLEVAGPGDAGERSRGGSGRLGLRGTLTDSGYGATRASPNESSGTLPPVVGESRGNRPVPTKPRKTRPILAKSRSSKLSRARPNRHLAFARGPARMSREWRLWDGPAASSATGRPLRMIISRRRFHMSSEYSYHQDTVRRKRSGTKFQKLSLSGRRESTGGMDWWTNSSRVRLSASALE